MTVTEPVWQLSVEQYHEMIRTGILTEDDPVELLDGWLVPKMPKNRPHSIATQRTRQALEQAIPTGWYVEAQEPVTLSRSESEPDAAVVRGSPERYPDAPPRPEDVGLVVEVANSTLHRDRTTKKRLYAEAGIPVFWIVNLLDRQVEVYRSGRRSRLPPAGVLPRGRRCTIGHRRPPSG
jgi:Uma2 family endonuclease